MLKKGILLGEAQDNVKIGKRDKLKGKYDVEVKDKRLNSNKDTNSIAIKQKN